MNPCPSFREEQRTKELIDGQGFMRTRLFIFVLQEKCKRQWFLLPYFLFKYSWTNQNKNNKR